jgi:glutamate:Na+ symporter, ESS family
VDLNQRQTLILAILVLFLGRWLNRRVAPLRDWNIPGPVTGGLVASLIFGLAWIVLDVQVTFTTDARDILLIVFFTTIGLSANVRLLAAGGRMLAILTLVAVVNLAIQTGLGVALATLMGANVAMGLLGGSVGLRVGTAPRSPGRRRSRKNSAWRTQWKSASPQPRSGSSPAASLVVRWVAISSAGTA